MRLRFAPSPTGPLHIGGVRTALYNYLLARKHDGVFILRIEDTDQARYVQGAEEYIKNALEWCGMVPDEGPDQGGEYGPYRQSERKDIYARYAQQLIDSGIAYYAFDTPEQLEDMRARYKEKGFHSQKYDASVRMEMHNSLSLPKDEVQRRMDASEPYTIRLHVTPNEEITFWDEIREDVSFQSNELDDKILMKADGFPTYHMANVIDDHLMKITHVIRGEEWLSSTAHHVLLYRAFGWEGTIPKFAHLPLILKPSGKGKLSKRDGAKFNMPVFPLGWKGEDEQFGGFKEAGFDPKALVNFLAFLGWNPGTEQEIFSIDELCEAFTMDRIGNSGAGFDYEKALWYNQQYIMATNNEDLLLEVRRVLESNKVQTEDSKILELIGLLKERVQVFPDFYDQGYFFFEPIKTYDEKTVRKKWSIDSNGHFENLIHALTNGNASCREEFENITKTYIKDSGIGFGSILPLIRVALSGSVSGPDVFGMMDLLGLTEVISRLENARELFPSWNS